MSNGSWSAIFLRNKYCPRIFELSVVAEIDFVFRRQGAVGRHEKNSLCTAHTAHRVGAARRASCHVDSRPATIRPWLSVPLIVVPKGHRTVSSTDTVVRDRPTGQSVTASLREFMSGHGPFVTEPSREFRRPPCPGNPAVRRRRTRTPRRARCRLRPPGARAARRALTGRTPRGRQHPAPVFHPTDPNTDPGLSQNGTSGKDGPGRAPARKNSSPDPSGQGTQPPRRRMLQPRALSWSRSRRAI